MTLRQRQQTLCMLVHVSAATRVALRGEPQAVEASQRAVSLANAQPAPVAWHALDRLSLALYAPHPALARGSIDSNMAGEAASPPTSSPRTVWPQRVRHWRPRSLGRFALLGIV